REKISTIPRLVSAVSDERLRAIAGADSVVANHLEKIAVNAFMFIPREVDESRDAAFWYFRAIPRLRGVYPERARRVEWALLRMTVMFTAKLTFQPFKALTNT